MKKISFKANLSEVKNKWFQHLHCHKNKSHTSQNGKKWTSNFKPIELNGTKFMKVLYYKCIINVLIIKYQ